MKARDIIPGWPRGRSTSRPYRAATHIAIESRYRTDIVNKTLVDTRWLEELESSRAEERRKADMMEEYWWIKREIAAGRYPWQHFHPIVHISTTVTPK